MSRFTSLATTSRRLQRSLGLLILFTLLAFAYLWPGPLALFERRTDQVLSDGTDPAALPYQYHVALDVWRSRPLALLYGAVPATTLNAPEGFALWMTWSERWVAVLLSPFLPVEQLSTAFVTLMLILDASAMHALGRRMGWSPSLSVAMAIGWAFSAYTRARAKVHMAFAGIYHVPLVFLGLILVTRSKGWRSVAGAATCFLIAMTVSQYYIVTVAFLSPFLLAYVLVSAGPRSEWPRVTARLALAALPAVLFVGWCYVSPVPVDLIGPGATIRPPTGETKSGELHPFLVQFAARPVDYWTGDVGLGDRDWNPVRRWLTAGVSRDLGNGNPHERANGIRWVIWMLALTAIVAAFHPKTKAIWPIQARRELLALAALGTFAFWLSLSPNVPFERAGPSYWLYSLVSQIRVPSRAGIHVQFAVLVMAGSFLHQVFEAPPFANGQGQRFQGWPAAESFRWLARPAVLPLIMIVELPPLLQAMPMAAVKPTYEELQGEECGAGLYFPYVSGTSHPLKYYYFLQQMRGSNCQILNAASPTVRNDWFLRRMPLHPQVLTDLASRRPRLHHTVARLAACVPLTWLVFDDHVPLPSRQGLCSSLGWKLSPDGVCRAPRLASPVAQKPERCV